MRFEWDEAKYAFYDPIARSVFDREIEGEQRWHTTGQVEGSILLLVVHTTREGGEDGFDTVVRIISARKTTPSERRGYEEGE